MALSCRGKRPAPNPPVWVEIFPDEGSKPSRAAPGTSPEEMAAHRKDTPQRHACARAGRKVSNAEPLPWGKAEARGLRISTRNKTEPIRRRKRRVVEET